MPKVLKFVLVLLFLIVLTVTVFKWLVLFFLTASFLPLLFFARIIKTNLHHLSPHIYHIKFPLVYVNPEFTNYKTLRFGLILSANLLSFFLFFLIFLRIAPKKTTKSLLSKFESIGSRLKKPKNIKRLKMSFLVIVVLALLCGHFLISPFINIYSVAKNVIPLASEIIFLLGNKKFEEVEKKLESAKEEIDIVQQNLDRLSWFKTVPLLKNYYYDAVSFTMAGNYALDSGLTVINILLNLNFESLEKAEKFTPQAEEILNNFSLAKEQIDKINPNRYPQKIGGKIIRDKIILAKNKVEELEKIRQAFQPLLKTFPEFIGGQKPKRFLVLFQDDNGLQPNGGCLTAYGVFRLEKGKIIPESSGNIGKYTNIGFFKARSDGVLTIDSEFFVNLFKVLGPTIVYDKVLSAETKAGCNCPSITADIQQLPPARKKEIIGVFLNAALVKSLSSPLKTQLEVLLAVLKSAQEKHLLIYLADPEQQKAIEAVLK